MMFWVGVLVAVVCSACSQSNPRSCVDGSCTDPTLPFCDVDGALQGEPKVCIAVECTAGEFEACRGDQAITCNSVGADYDLIQCQLGCDPAALGCRGCADSSDCSNPTPYCDVSNYECRGCRVDSECASTVCDLDAGTCTPPSEIVYASPAGLDTATCTQANPCSLNQAVALAATNPSRSTVRMTPGDYVKSIVISAGTIKIVGTGATLAAQFMEGHQFLRGSDVSVRGLRFNLASGGMYCGFGLVNTAALGGTLRLRSVTIVPANQHTLQLQGCVFSATDLSVPALDAFQPVVRSDTEFTVDRSKFSQPVGDGMLVIGARITFTVTNSVFDNVYLSLDPRDQTGSTSRVVFAFNTVVRQGTLALGRSEPGNTGTFLTFIENNIFVVGTGTDAIICAGCSLANNVINRQMTALPASNLIVDPKLVDTVGRDFHLQAGSPAIDAAMPSLGITTDHDFEGNKRPQGPRMDIGAFERL